MPRTVGVTETVDGLGEDLDPAGWRAQRVTVRIGAEIGEEHLPRLGHWKVEPIARPELVETRKIARPLRGPPLIVQMAQPLQGSAALGEFLTDTEPFGNIRQDRVIVAGLAVRAG